jgi:hypothetical protein
LFGNGKKTAPAVQVAQGNADIHMPTQHNSFGFNWTYLSQSSTPLNQMIYGVANSVNIPVQYLMGRGVGDGSMRNLDGTSTSTDEGVMAFVSVMSLSNLGIGNGAVSAAKGGFDAVGAFKNAISPFKGSNLTNAGRAVTKHPGYFGFESTEALMGAYRTPGALNNLGSTTLKGILRNGVRTTGAGGRYPNGWTTYTLPNGNAASWGLDGTFIGFRGIK